MKVIEYDLERKGQQIVFAAKAPPKTEQDREKISGYLDWLKMAHPEAYDALTIAAECTVRLEDLL